MLGVEIELARMTSLPPPSSPSPYASFLTSLTSLEKSDRSLANLHPTNQLSLLICYALLLPPDPAEFPHLPYLNSLPAAYSTVSTSWSARSLTTLATTHPLTFRKALGGRITLLRT
jgi:hypothetical protein